jgi:hypothetical protein
LLKSISSYYTHAEFYTDPLPSSGTYTILVWDDGRTGEYLLYLYKMNEPSDVAQIGFGETMSSSIDALLEIDAYSFDAVEGDIVRVKIRNSSIYPDIRLYGPDGSLLESISSYYTHAEFDTDPLPSSGTYTILVWDDDRTGEYTISFALIMGTPGSLIIMPTEGLHASGFIGETFSPLSTTYTLENQGDVAIEWTVTKTQDWVDISKEWGTVDAGGSDTVTVSINSVADTLDIGTYTDTITFHNITETDRLILRTVSLTIKIRTYEGILEVTPSEAFNTSGPPGGPFHPSNKTYTLENTGGKSINWKASLTEYWLTLSSEHGALGAGETANVIVSINDMADDLAKGAYMDTVTFTNTTNGYGDTTRDVELLIDVSASNITCELSKESIVLGEPVEVSGEITPGPGVGAFVDIVITPPDGEAEYIPILANSLGQFSYNVDCEDIYEEGDWSISTRWGGNDAYEGAVSDVQALYVTKAQSRVSLDLTSHSVKLGDKVSISGKFTPQPDCGRDLSEITLMLIISGPYGTTTKVVQTNDQWGHFTLQDYEGFNSLGEWTVQAVFMGDEAYNESASESLTIQVVETAGYAIIVEGKHSSGEGLDSHNKTANFVYKTLRERGILDEDIKYFSYSQGDEYVIINGQSTLIERDGLPSKTGIQDAITIWAKDKMDPAYDNPNIDAAHEVVGKPANLYIIMVDHGLEDVFYITPDTIASSDLRIWLDTLQDSLTGQAAEQEIIVVLGFCRSGSFIDDLSEINRVIIASAASNESSYKGPLDQDGIREGEYFVSEFFKSVSLGKSVKSCFKDAVTLTEVFTSKGITGSTNAPYFDNSRQHPLLDDNGDGIGSNDLSGQDGDGLLSEDIIIGVSSITGNDPGDVSIIEVVPTIFLDENATAMDGLWARVDNNSRLMTIWVEVKPPDYDPDDPEGSGQAVMDLFKVIYSSYNSVEDRYDWPELSGFDDPGTYQVYYFAKDDISGNVSPLMEGRVYKAVEGNNPPGSFDLLEPYDNEDVTTMLVLMWNSSNDPDNDPVTYTVEISEDPDFGTLAYMVDGIADNYCFIGAEAGLADLSAYYWRVIAIDQYGAQAISETCSFKTDNTNGILGFLTVLVFDETGHGITGAEINSDMLDKTFVTNESGLYMFELPSGNYTFTIEASGYEMQTANNVVILAEGNAVLHFIMSSIAGEGYVDLVAGWNLISLCTQPSDMNIEALLDSIIDKVISVWEYENGNWQVYDPAKPGFSDLTKMDAGRGYWINMSEEANLTISGSTPSNSIDLSAGWNLLGYNSDTAQDIADALASIEYKYISVWAYMDGGWKVYDPANPGFSDLLTMEPAYGYWINAKEPSTWTLP